MAKVEGLPQLISKFKKFGEAGERLSKATVQSVGDLIVAEAQRLAPSDLGAIRQGINKESKKGGYVAEIYSNAPESPYQEFGTGAQVKVPVEMTAEASKFKGGNGENGTFEDFVKALTGWVQRKGITATYSIKTRRRSKAGNSTANADEKMATVIAMAILKRGLTPKPFLYPAWLLHAPKLPKLLLKALKRLANERSE